MTEEIQFGPERRRGDQAVRFGREGQTTGGGKGRGRGPLPPNELAAWKLNQALEKHPIFTKEARENIQNRFVDMEGLRTMNMKVLAATLAFMRSVGNITPDKFKDDIIMPNLIPLLPTTEMAPEDYKRLIIRFKAQVLIYYRAIVNEMGDDDFIFGDHP